VQNSGGAELHVGDAVPLLLQTARKILAHFALGTGSVLFPLISLKQLLKPGIGRTPGFVYFHGRTKKSQLLRSKIPIA
jgi:hypothetical protein